MAEPEEILWTERASADIEAIVRYIVRRDPEAAGRIGRGIYERVQILFENPVAEAGYQSKNIESTQVRPPNRWRAEGGCTPSNPGRCAVMERWG